MLADRPVLVSALQSSQILSLLMKHLDIRQFPEALFLIDPY